MASNAELRSVNGSWFCPVCFISCSTKGNLRRHMRKIHADQSSGETANGNSTKFIFLEGDNFEEDQYNQFNEEVTGLSCGLNLRFSNEDSCSSTSSQEQEVDLDFKSKQKRSYFHLGHPNALQTLTYCMPG